MKRLLIFELLLLILATTFESDSPPGWFQQVLPRADVTVQDIFFLDSLTGYTVTRKNTNDSSFIYKTIDGGSNWSTTLSENIYLTSIQFVDNNTGYSVGSAPGGIIKKTTNSGLNWFTVNVLAPYPLLDLSFVNKDTGWVCSDDPLSGGVFKTTDGGLNWQQQLGSSFFIQKLFFISKDTGWAGSNQANGKLYRTTNGGQVWNLQYTSNGAVESIFFLNNQKGWIRGGTGNGVAYTTDGGLNWLDAQGEIGGFDIKFVNDSIGYAGGGSQPLRIIKSTNGGRNWGYQTAAVTADISVAVLKSDTFLGWAGKQVLNKTTDGGGPITFTGITQIGNEVPTAFKLYQNYPNPFNPVTNIKYSITPNVNSRTSDVKLIVYDILGKEITVLVNQKQNAGTYKVDFDASGLPSGVYFYSLFAEGIMIETKKMLLVK